MGAPAWRATEVDIAAIVGARHGDPFAVLGPHNTGAGLVVRALVPGARSVAICEPDGATAMAMTCRHPDGFFEALFPDGSGLRRYRLRAEDEGGTWEFDDPFSFGPVLGALDDHLLIEGTHHQLYARLGAHPMTVDEVSGVHFAVWA